jgi:hypothetical protein
MRHRARLDLVPYPFGVDGQAAAVARLKGRGATPARISTRPTRAWNESSDAGKTNFMADLAQLLQQTMRRRHLNAQALADRTGIRTPRIRAFAEDGAHGPVQPTEQELCELAAALGLPLPTVLAAARAPIGAPA